MESSASVGDDHQAPAVPSSSLSFKDVSKLLWFDFKTSYSTTYTLKWSLWWAFAMCGYFQVLNYIQPLWEDVSTSDESLYNGAVEATHTFLSRLRPIIYSANKFSNKMQIIYQRCRSGHRHRIRPGGLVRVRRTSHSGHFVI